MLVAVAAPVAAVSLLFVLVAGGAGATPPPPPPAPGCGPGGTATTVGDVTLDAEQMGNAQVIVTVTASRGLPPQAAVIAIAASYTEAKLRNDLVQRDHDSIGLFQIRAGLYGQQVAEDPVASTHWFLDQLVQLPNWRTVPLTDAAADVERPAAQYRGRYAAAQPLATSIVGQLWPAARASVAGSDTGSISNGSTSNAAGPEGVSEADPHAGELFPEPPAVCPGGQGGGAPTDAVACTVGGEGQVVLGPGSVPIRICTAGPWTVDTTIAPQIAALHAAASAAGVNLGGGGYRSNAEQIATRRANCGPTDYDIYDKPASQCSPPTARPGMSRHEWAQALDITSNGVLIRSRNNPAFQWLNANAGNYGLSNLPSEPWHWSTNGR